MHARNASHYDDWLHDLLDFEGENSILAGNTASCDWRTRQLAPYSDIPRTVALRLVVSVDEAKCPQGV
jgi:hypothetical protein